jgi:NADPH:quinone reductase-like Zn-dependent oxidoreductase
MRAVICSAYGPPEVLKLADVPTPAPTAGEVRIRVRATAVTSSDCYVRGLDLDPRYRLLARLALGWKAPRQPILGMVLSGEIDVVVSGVTRFSEGDVVFGFDRHRYGTYAQYVCWPQESLLVSRPANLTNEEAAAIPYGGLLALHFLRRAEVAAGQHVLIYGASGAPRGPSALRNSVPLQKRHDWTHPSSGCLPSASTSGVASPTAIPRGAATRAAHRLSTGRAVGSSRSP